MAAPIFSTTTRTVTECDFTDECWQGIAGGAEGGEWAEQSARREMMEEAGIPIDAPLVRLDTIASIPTSHFARAMLGGLTST